VIPWVWIPLKAWIFVLVYSSAASFTYYPITDDIQSSYWESVVKWTTKKPPIITIIIQSLYLCIFQQQHGRTCAQMCMFMALCWGLLVTFFLPSLHFGVIPDHSFPAYCWHSLCLVYGTVCSFYAETCVQPLGSLHVTAYLFPYRTCLSLHLLCRTPYIMFHCSLV
jgi:hypothetical protein